MCKCRYECFFYINEYLYGYSCGYTHHLFNLSLLLRLLGWCSQLKNKQHLKTKYDSVRSSYLTSYPHHRYSVPILIHVPHLPSPLHPYHHPFTHCDPPSPRPSKLLVLISHHHLLHPLLLLATQSLT